MMRALITSLALVALAASAPAANAAAIANPLRGATIALDPGHNGANARHLSAIERLVNAGGFRKACDTTGTATADNSLSEASFNWDLARRLQRLLKRTGAKVVMTRKSNRGVGPCIDRRAAIGNHAKADVAISIHADGGPPNGRGFHVIHPGLVRGYTDQITRPSLRLALKVRAELDRAGILRSNYRAHRGLDSRKDIGGLNRSKVPKVLVELGNMQNAEDARLLKSRRWRERTARALRVGLAEYLTK